MFDFLLLMVPTIAWVCILYSMLKTKAKVMEIILRYDAYYDITCGMNLYLYREIL